MNFNNFKIRRRNRRRRNGAAAVEAALCMPVVIILMFGTLEACSGIFLTESLKIVAYEGARVGVRRGATFDMVEARCQEVLSARGVKGGTVTITPGNFADLLALQPVNVTVEAPYSGNSLFAFSIFTGHSAEGAVSMMREFDD